MSIRQFAPQSTTLLSQSLMDKMNEASKMIIKRSATKEQIQNFIEGLEVYVNNPKLMDDKKYGDHLTQIVSESMEKLVSIAPGRDDVSL